MGDFRAAIDSLSSVPHDHPDAGLPAIGMSSDWFKELGEYEKAIELYRKILATNPSATISHRHLAEVFNRLGYRQSASEHVRVLCTSGDVSQQELASLVCYKNLATSNPIGRVAEARQAFALDNFDLALKLLLNSDEGTANALNTESLALLGRVATETQDRAAIITWWRQLDERQANLAEHWYALGLLTLQYRNQPQLSAELLMESVARDPTDWVAYGVLENLMNRIGNRAAENEFNIRALRLKRSIVASNRIASSKLPQRQHIEPLAVLLAELQRPLEANLWRYIATSNATPPTASTQEELVKLQRRHQEII
jgi:tetratricopeptide (TPR) repeat protein